MSDFPIIPDETWEIIDPSKIQEYMSCPRKYFYRYMLGWRYDNSNVHLVFGEAWHRAMEYLLKHDYSENSITEAFNLFIAYYRESYPPMMDELNGVKTPANALMALVEYTTKYAQDKFEVLHTETAGSVPITEDWSIHFRVDSICKDERGIFSLSQITCPLNIFTMSINSPKPPGRAYGQ